MGTPFLSHGPAKGCYCMLATPRASQMLQLDIIPKQLSVWMPMTYNACQCQCPYQYECQSNATNVNAYGKIIAVSNAYISVFLLWVFPAISALLATTKIQAPLLHASKTFRVWKESLNSCAVNCQFGTTWHVTRTDIRIWSLDGVARDQTKRCLLKLTNRKLVLNSHGKKG